MDNSAFKMVGLLAVVCFMQSVIGSDIAVGQPAEESPGSDQTEDDSNSPAPDVSALEQRTESILDNLREAVQEARQLEAILARMPDTPELISATHLPVAAAEADAKHVHALLIGHDRDGRIGEGVKANLRFIKALIDHQSKGKVTFYEATGRDFSRAGIANRIAEISAGPDETIFCYVACHGATARDGSHTFQLGRDSIKRTDLLAALRDKNCRQSILISDSCSVEMNVTTVPLTVERAVERPTHLLSLLLFRHQGVVDINGSSPPETGLGPRGDGEFGWYIPQDSPQGGGIFTRAFVYASLYADGKSWQSLFTDASTRTRINFDRIKDKSEVSSTGQTSQTPHVYRH